MIKSVTNSNLRHPLLPKMHILTDESDGCGYKEPEIYLNGQLIDGDSDDFFDKDFRVDDRNIPQNNRGLYRGISKVTYTGKVPN